MMSLITYIFIVVFRASSICMCFYLKFVCTFTNLFTFSNLFPRSSCMLHNFHLQFVTHTNLFPSSICYTYNLICIFNCIRFYLKSNFVLCFYMLRPKTLIKHLHLGSTNHLIVGYQVLS